MIIVFDENFSKKLAEGLNLLEKSNPGWAINAEVLSAEAFMGYKGAEDSVVYEKIGKEGLFITKDKDFKHIKMYGKSLEKAKAKVLFFKSSKRLITHWDYVKIVIVYWIEIKELLTRTSPPYVYEFDINRGIKECHV